MRLRVRVLAEVSPPQKGKRFPTRNNRLRGQTNRGKKTLKRVLEVRQRVGWMVESEMDRIGPRGPKIEQVKSRASIKEGEMMTQSMAGKKGWARTGK